MPLDPDIAEIIAEIARRENAFDLALPIDRRRRQYDVMMREVMGHDEVPGIVSADAEIPGPGGPIPIRVSRPDGSSPADRLPTVVYLHGGSWIVGSIESYDPVTRRIARAVPAVVVSVGYRLAPEHPFPAGYLDAESALDWAIAHVEQLGGDPSTMVLSGDSAGGNFTAALSIAARDRGVGFAAQLMFYPSSDLSRRYPSMDEFETGYLLETPPVAFADEEYLVDPALRSDPRVSPILSASFADLPPAVVVTAEYDPIKDHGDILVDAYRAAGVVVLHREAPGMIHGFLHAGRSAAALGEIDRACAALGLLLRSSTG
jgi:acetyl esterase